MAWLVDENENVDATTEMCDIETEKLTGPVEAGVAGILARRVVAEGETVPVGALLAVITDGAVDDAVIDEIIANAEIPVVEVAAETGPSRQVVDVAGHKVAFMEEGEGAEPIVLIHGFGGSADNWMFVQSALAEHHRVIAVDLPGHGDSSKEVLDGGVEAVAEIVHALAQDLELERFHLVGHSFGGLVAMLVALREPARVRSLTLISTAGLGTEINAAYVEGFLTADSRRAMRPYAEMLFADSALVSRALLDDMLRAKRSDGATESLRALATHAFPSGSQNLVVADQLELLNVPLLVLWGEDDQIIPTHHADRARHRADVRVLPGVGHSPHVEAPGQVNRAVAELLKSGDGDGR